MVPIAPARPASPVAVSPEDPTRSSSHWHDAAPVAVALDHRGRHPSESWFQAEIARPLRQVAALYAGGWAELTRPLTRAPIRAARSTVVAVFTVLMVLDCVTTTVMVQAGSNFSEANGMAAWGQGHFTMVGYNVTVTCIELAIVVPLLATRVRCHFPVALLNAVAYLAVAAKLVVVANNVVLWTSVPLPHL